MNDYSGVMQVIRLNTEGSRQSENIKSDTLLQHRSVNQLPPLLHLTRHLPALLQLSGQVGVVLKSVTNWREWFVMINFNFSEEIICWT